MGNDLHLAVRIAAAGYILYKVWRLLFRERLFGLWDRIFTGNGKPTSKAAAPVKEKSHTAVMGRTNIVLLDDPRRAVSEPVAGSELEPTGFIGHDAPVAADEVDAPEPPPVPGDDELYGDEPPPGDDGMSSGVSFQELSDAAEVLVAGTQDGKRRKKAAKTLYNIQNTEILDFIVSEVCSAETIENLLRECLDGDGFPLKKRDAPAEFDMGKYV